MTRFAWLVALVACSARSTATGDAPASSDAPATIDTQPPIDAGSVTVLATGTISNVTYRAACGPTVGKPVGSTQADFRCAQITVTCPGLDDAVAEVALTPTPAVTSKGAIVTHSGSEGLPFEAGTLQEQLASLGWDLGQIAWDSPWECPKHTGAACAIDPAPATTRAGLKNAACRPATVIKWIHEQAQRPDGSAFWTTGQPFCGTGGSAGSGVFWYSLAHYGLSSEIDYALLTASSPFGRVEVGCDPSYATTRVTPACQNVTAPDVPLNYDSAGSSTDPNGGAAPALDKWFSTQSCDSAPTADELALYARNSILSPGADFGFATPVSTYNCVDPKTVNVVPGLGQYVFAVVHASDPQSAKFKSECVVTGPSGNGTCSGEGVLQDPTALATAVADLDSNCKVLTR